MPTLSDGGIKEAVREGKLQFTPELRDEQIGPASVDLRLGSTFRVFRVGRFTTIDPKQGVPSDFLEPIIREDTEPFVCHPHDFVLSSTLERLKLADNLIGRVEGKSTIARMGIIVHAAGFVDPGYEGTLTLEISNQANIAMLLYPGMYICQISFQTLDQPAEVPYNRRQRSLYTGDQGPTPPRTTNLFPSRG